MQNDVEKSIHSLIYWSVCESCYDREYIYRAFVLHFGQLCQQLFVQLPAPEIGEYRFKGIKSNKNILIRWKFMRRLNYCGSNYITLEVVIHDTITGAKETKCATFNVNTGRNIDDEEFI